MFDIFLNYPPYKSITMQRLLLFLGIMLLTKNLSVAQTDCTNIGFELGNTDGWTFSSGTLTDDGTKAVYGAEVSGAIYQITKVGDGNDTKVTQEKIPMVASGSNYAIRLGSTTQGGSYQRLRTSFVVTQDNTLFQYYFAVLLANDNSGHKDFQKPGFNIQITDQNGNSLPCSYFDVQLSSSGTAATFSTQSYSDGIIEYKNWTTGAIDLHNYIGQRIYIQVTSHGCTKQKHFGYVYFDAQCAKSEVISTSSCPDDDGNMTLKAPDGFAKYTWSNGATTSSIKVKATVGSTYTVKVLPLSSLDASCEFQLSYTIQYKHPYNTVDATICEDESFVVGSNSYKTTGQYVVNISKAGICDSTVTLNLTVLPKARYTQNVNICAGSSFTVGSNTYTTTGTYVTTIKRVGKCDSIVTTNLKVIDVSITLATKDYSLIAGESVLLKASVGTPLVTYLWSPATDLACPTCAETWAKPQQSRQYMVFVTSTENATCKDNEIINISVRNCELVFIPQAFTPNQDNQNDFFFVYGSGCVKQIKNLRVFDRWGELLFWRETLSTTDVSTGWDGTYKGTPMQSGSYAYELEVELLDGTSYQRNGAIFLIR